MSEPSIFKPRPTPALSYLVLVQPMLVAVDIGWAIQEFVPRANVIVAQSEAEARQAMKAVDSIHVAFLSLAPSSENGRRLAEAVRVRGGRLVFIGDEAEDVVPGPDWTVLVRPFSTNCVRAALKGLPQTRPAAQSLMTGQRIALADGT